MKNMMKLEIGNSACPARVILFPYILLFTIEIDGHVCLLPFSLSLATVATSTVSEVASGLLWRAYLNVTDSGHQGMDVKRDSCKAGCEWAQ